MWLLCKPLCSPSPPNSPFYAGPDLIYVMLLSLMPDLFCSPWGVFCCLRLCCMLMEGHVVLKIEPNCQIQLAANVNNILFCGPDFCTFHREILCFFCATFIWEVLLIVTLQEKIFQDTYYQCIIYLKKIKPVALKHLGELDLRFTH